MKKKVWSGSFVLTSCETAVTATSICGRKYSFFEFFRQSIKFCTKPSWCASDSDINLSSEIFPVSIPLKGSFPPCQPKQHQHHQENKTFTTTHILIAASEFFRSISKGYADYRYVEFKSDFWRQWERIRFNLFESLFFVQRSKEGNRNSSNAWQSFNREEICFKTRAVSSWHILHQLLREHFCLGSFTTHSCFETSSLHRCHRQLPKEHFCSGSFSTEENCFETSSLLHCHFCVRSKFVENLSFQLSNVCMEQKL